MIYHTHIAPYHIDHVDITSHSHHIISCLYHILAHQYHATPHLRNIHIRSHHCIAQAISESPKLLFLWWFETVIKRKKLFDLLLPFLMAVQGSCEIFFCPQPKLCSCAVQGFHIIVVTVQQYPLSVCALFANVKQSNNKTCLTVPKPH